MRRAGIAVGSVVQRRAHARRSRLRAVHRQGARGRSRDRRGHRGHGRRARRDCAGGRTSSRVIAAAGMQVLARLASWAERHTGLPAWASVPSMLLGISLLTAVLGMYWDISLHIDNGRDAGPLANPAHYLILIGLYGVLVAGVLSIALAGTERPAKTAVHLGGDWWAPVGGLMMAACGAFALTGFPLDDMWHRLFGQDVTLWGPTHLMLIGGASLATLGGMVLMGEAITSVGRDPEREGTPWVYHLRRALLVGGFLVALSTFQAEFDFGVPQFRAVFQPILIMLAAGIGLVTTRLYLGRGGALLGGGRLHGDPRLPRDHGRRRLGPDDAALPALHRRGAAGGGGVRTRGWPQPGGERRHRRRADRDGRARGRVGAGRTSGCRFRGTTRCCPRPPIAGFITAVAAGARGRLHRRLAGRPERRADQPRGRPAARAGRPPRGAGLRTRADGRDRLGAADVGQRPGARAGVAAGHRRRRASARWPPRSGSTRATRSRIPSS